MALLEDLVNIREYLGKLESNKQLLESSIFKQREELVELKNKHVESTDQISLDIASSSVIQDIFDKVSNSGFSYLEQLLDQALTYVYPQRDFAIKIKVGVRGSEKTAEFYLWDGVCESALSECSGGVNTIVSLTLQVYYISKNSLRKLLVMDEKLGAMDKDSIQLIIPYLRMLVDELGFTILFVTQNRELCEVDVIEAIYEIYKGKAEKVK